MTRSELRASKEYIDSVEKIRGYHKGFKFTIPYYKMTVGQKNAMRIILIDCQKEGLIKSTSIGLDLSLEIQEETFERI